MEPRKNLANKVRETEGFVPNPERPGVSSGKETVNGILATGMMAFVSIVGHVGGALMVLGAVGGFIAGVSGLVRLIRKKKA